MRSRASRTAPRGQGALFERQQSGGGAQRPVPLRERRRRRRALVACGALTLAVVGAFGLQYLSYLPRFTVGSFEVRGAEHLSARLVASAASAALHDGSYHFLSRATVVWYPRADIEAALAARFPRIKEVSLSRQHPLSTAIEVTIKERQPFATWCAGEILGYVSADEATASACYLLDETGFLFARAAYASTTEYIFHGGMPEAASSTDFIGRSFVRAQLPALSSVLRALGQAGFGPRGAEVVGEQDFVIPLARGFVVKASFGQDAGTLVKNLQLVLSSEALREKEEEIEYIDLRFGNRVYYKLRGEAESPAS